MSLKVDQKAKFVPRGISVQFVDEAQYDSQSVESVHEGKVQLPFKCALRHSWQHMQLNIMDSPHSSTTSAAMPVYQTLLPFFPLQFSNGVWHRGSGDKTIIFTACL